MNQNEKNLFQLCKIGDLSKVQQLVEKEDIQLNIRDKWDSTPLYYACLCGHIDLVEYLLDNGARCEANTFDGERCLYGALTDQIRNVLKNFKIATTKLDQYDLHLERLFELSPYADITFEIKGKLFKAHKFILSARSEYFRAKFENKWKNRSWISGDHEELVPESFESVLKYIYTGRFTTLKVYFKSCLRLAKLFKLKDLIENFNTKLFNLSVNLSESASQYQNEDNDIKLTEFNSNDQLADEQAPINETDIFLIGKFGVNSKLSNTITIQCQDQVANDFKKLAFYCLPKELRDENLIKQEHNLSNLVDLTHDFCLNLEDQFKFNVHKAFMAERCDYFKAFLHDPFNENRIERCETSNKNNRRIVSHINLKEITADVLIEIIFFIYSNNFSKDKLDEFILYDVLLVADLYLLPSLKRKCASELIANHLNKENLFDLFKLSRLYDLKKLEFACITYLANNLFDYVSSVELREIIREDAKSLKMRQETDTIDIIDDLRYAINESSNYSYALNETSTGLVNNINTKNLSLTDRLIDKECKLNLVDKILKELNLEC